MMKNKQNNKKTSYSVSTSLFYGTTILGLLLIIINIFFDLSWIPGVDPNNQSLKWWFTIFSKTSSTVGIALLLSNLTKLFTKKDEEEKEKNRRDEVETSLKNIVVSKDFLGLFSEEEKKNIIAKLLTPENDSLNKHSNIKEYLDQKSDKYLNFFNINFRSHMVIDIDVSISKHNNIDIFIARYKIYYRIYKINDKYEPICIFSEKEHVFGTTIIKNNSGEEVAKLGKDDLIPRDGKYYYDIPEKCNDYNFLIIERNIIEYGHPHWITINWRSLTPIEGITYKVTCKKGIIKEHHIFDNDNLYEKPELSEDRTTLKINSSQWLDPYTGISVIVANPSDDDNFPKVSDEKENNGN